MSFRVFWINNWKVLVWIAILGAVQGVPQDVAAENQDEFQIYEETQDSPGTSDPSDPSDEVPRVLPAPNPDPEPTQGPPALDD